MKAITLIIYGLPGTGKTLVEEKVKEVLIKANMPFLSAEKILLGDQDVSEYKREYDPSFPTRIEYLGNGLNSVGVSLIVKTSNPGPEEEIKSLEERIKNCKMIYCNASMKDLLANDKEGYFKKVLLTGGKAPDNKTLPGINSKVNYYDSNSVWKINTFTNDSSQISQKLLSII